MAEASSAAQASEIDQMKRKASGNWTLEGDAFLLSFMRDISNNLDARCAKTTKNLNQMTVDLDRISVDLGNTTNKLLFISNSKFVENRVQEEDETVTFKSKRAIEEKPQPMDSVEAIKIAAQNSLKMLDQCYEKVSFNLESGDESDDDEEDKNNNTVLRPKDPFAQQMPFLIGSREWKEKWHVGLVDSDVESDEEVDEGQYSESSQEESIRSLSSTSLPSNAPTYSESEGSIWGLQQQTQSHQPSKLFQPDDEDAVSSRSSVAGFRSSNTDFMNNRGGVPVLPTPSTRSMVAPPLLQEPPPHFAATTAAKKPVGGGLFDDDEDDFDGVDQNANRKQQPVARNPAPSMIFPQQRLPEPRKVVNLFDDLPPDDDEADWAKPTPVEKRPADDDLFTARVTKPIVKEKTGGLFDDDDDFIPRAVDKPKARITNLFDDDGPEDDYFDVILSRNEATKPKPAKPSEQPKKKSEPAKVSAPLFDDGPENDFFDAVLTKAKPAAKRSDPVQPGEAKKKSESAKMAGPLFDDEPEDDIFNSKPTLKPSEPKRKSEPTKTVSAPKSVDTVKPSETQKKTEPTKAPPKPESPKPAKKKIVNLFDDTPPSDDDFDELFKPTKGRVKPTTLFGDDSIAAPIPTMSVNTQDVDKISIGSSDRDVPRPKPRTVLETAEVIKEKVVADEKKLSSVAVEKVLVEPKKVVEEPPKEIVEQQSYIEDLPPEDDDFEVTPKAKLSPFMQQLFNKEPMEGDIFEQPPPLEKSDKSTYQSMPLFDDVPPDDEFGFAPASTSRDSDDDFFDENVQELPAKPPSSYLILDEPPADDFEEPVPVTKDVDKKTENPPSVLKKIQQFSDAPEASEPKEEKPNRPVPKKLNTADFKINMAALLPGARLPPKQAAPEAPAAETIANDIEYTLRKNETPAPVPEEKPPTAAAPTNPTVLSSLGRNRAKMPMKRQPSTRKARQQSYQQSLADQVMDASTDEEVEQKEPPTPVVVVAKQPAFLVETENDLFAEISKQPAVVSSSVKTSEKSAPKQKGLASTSKTIQKRQDEQPIIKIAQKVPTTVTRVEKPLSRVVLPQPPGALFEDDLFSSPFQPGRMVAPKTIPAKPKVVAAQLSSPDDDDLFGPPKVKKVVDTSKGAVPKMKKDLFDTPDDDDFFSIPVKKTVAAPVQKQDPVVNKPVQPKAMAQKQQPTVVQREGKKSMSLFSDDDDDPMQSKTQTKAPKLTQSRVEKKSLSLFGGDDDDDSDDLFGGGAKKVVQPKEKTVQPKKAVSKVLQKPKANSSKLFDDDDDDDDLFGSSKKSVAPPSVVRAAAPAPVRKTSLKTTTAPALDDPLADLLK